MISLEVYVFIVLYQYNMYMSPSTPRSLAAAHAALGAWLRASYPASGRAGMVGGRHRWLVSDRAKVLGSAPRQAIRIRNP